MPVLDNRLARHSRVIATACQQPGTGRQRMTRRLDLRPPAVGPVQGSLAMMAPISCDVNAFIDRVVTLPCAASPRAYAAPTGVLRKAPV